MPDRKVRAKQPDGSIEHQIDRRQREVEEIEARQAGREIAERVSEKFSEALTKSQERRLAAGRKGKVQLSVWIDANLDREMRIAMAEQGVKKLEDWVSHAIADRWGRA